MGHKPFLVYSWLSSRNGHYSGSSLWWRGVGGSRVNIQKHICQIWPLTLRLLFHFLINNPKINQKEIGFIGHSEGGLIAPIVAASTIVLDYCLNWLGPGVTGQQIIVRQSEDISRLFRSEGGGNKRKLQRQIKSLYSVLRKEKDNNLAETKNPYHLQKDPLKRKKLPMKIRKKAVNQLKLTFGANTYTWFQIFYKWPTLQFSGKKVKCPVLALDGRKGPSGSCWWKSSGYWESVKIIGE